MNVKIIVRVLGNWIRFRVLHRKSSAQVHVLQSFSMYSRFLLKKESILVFGRNIVSDGRGQYYVDSNALLDIGTGVYFNDGIKISCKNHIKIGEGCLFGPDVKIYDNNHMFSGREGVSFRHTIGEVRIGKNCWIAANAIILKGAEIGDNCLVGAGCVIDQKIPSGSKVTQKQGVLIQPLDR